MFEANVKSTGYLLHSPVSASLLPCVTVCHYISTELYALLPLPKIQSVLRAENIKIYRALTKPVETHRAESWTLNTDIAKWLLLKEK